jgi:hypothetical protein
MTDAKMLLSMFLLLNACGNKTNFSGPATGALDAEVNQIRLTQIERSALTDSFVQGRPEEHIIEEFSQGESYGALDLQIVIDTSGSMDAEQANLSSKLEPLLSYIGKSDWRIHVTTTDKDDGCHRSLITRDTPNKMQLFANAIQAGIGGSGDELGLYQAVQGLNCTTNPWLRPTSALAVLIVSDEDNCSTGVYGECLGTNSGDSSYLFNFLKAVRNPGANARVYGLIAHPTKACPTALNTGNVYAKLIDDTNGKWGSICDADYTDTLTSISQDLAGILESRFYLEAPPVADSVKVYVNDVPYPLTDYKIVNHMIIFTKPPMKDAKITLDYQTDDTSLETTFALSNDFAEDDLKVYFDDVLVDPKTYYLDAENRRVSFDNAPPEKTVIKVEYREKTELPSDFEIEKGLNGNELSVRINNEVVTEFGYDPTTGILSFATPPADGAEILVGYTD